MKGGWSHSLCWLRLRSPVGGWILAGRRRNLPAILKSASNRPRPTLPSNDERGRLTMDCNARFAGRRKPGGGYTYYDFMQNRNFDIAGPNPTAEERKQIDREYMSFLDAQRREDMSAELARRQNEQLQANMESARQPVGPPMILLPRKRPIDRSKPGRCEDASLSCSWAKFSAVVKNAFASSSRKKP